MRRICAGPAADIVVNTDSSVDSRASLARASSKSIRSHRARFDPNDELPRERRQCACARIDDVTPASASATRRWKANISSSRSAVLQCPRYIRSAACRCTLYSGVTYSAACFCILTIGLSYPHQTAVRRISCYKLPFLTRPIPAVH